MYVLMILNNTDTQLEVSPKYHKYSHFMTLE